MYYGVYPVLACIDQIELIEVSKIQRNEFHKYLPGEHKGKELIHINSDLYILRVVLCAFIPENYKLLIHNALQLPLGIIFLKEDYVKGCGAIK